MNTLSILQETRSTFVKELQKCERRVFTHESWTDEAYISYSRNLKEKIEELDRMISKRSRA